MFFFETDRHIGHIELYKVLIINGLYIILCILCAYVFQKKTILLVKFIIPQKAPNHNLYSLIQFLDDENY